MNTGKVIPVAYPDTFVQYSTENVQNKIFPFLGLGKNNYIKAGHALLLLVENSTGIIKYFDFGRYVTPPGKGRVRSEVTDVELHIPIKAKISKNGNITNIEEILIWLEAYPEKTHGEGRVVASVCHEIDYNKALNYILDLQEQGSIPYMTFKKEGSNCSRLVTDTLIRSCNNPKIVKKLKRNSLFTPSPLGNVLSGSNGGIIYNVYKGKCTVYNNSVFKENLTNYFDPRIPKKSKEFLPREKNGAQLLKAIGASAYFKIQQTGSKDLYIIERYNSSIKKDFQGIFKVNDSKFSIKKQYKFVFDCNCSYCHIEQEKKIFRFDLIKQKTNH